MTVWLIWYDDDGGDRPECLYGIYTTREQAKQVMDGLNTTIWQNPEIEEWFVDEPDGGPV